MIPGRRWAVPLTPLYWAALRTKDALRTAGILRMRQLRWPVISVGSLSAGGAGKTPVVIALAELLRNSGHTVSVLSRGYGRQGREIERVDLTAPNPAQRFGDEPVLIATTTGFPVWVGSDRHAAGLAAEQASCAAGIHLLDDGFQHRRLARTFDVVLLTVADLDDALLPAGNRREPLSALRRADAVVLREEERESLEPRIRRWLRPNTPIWSIRRTLHIPQINGQPELLLAFSGIARPQSFVEMLKTCGLRVIDSVAFPDHHRYTADDMRRLVERLRSAKTAAFITTEKDAVKITPELRTTLEASAPMLVANLRVEFADPAEVTRELEARCL
jgi:tetraacyldisaccharide 4'-kinase